MDVMIDWTKDEQFKAAVRESMSFYHVSIQGICQTCLGPRTGDERIGGLCAGCCPAEDATKDICSVCGGALEPFDGDCMGACGGVA